MIRFLEIVSFVLAWGYTLVFFLILRAFLPLRKNLFLKIAAFVVCGYLADSIIYSNDLGSLLGTMALFFCLYRAVLPRHFHGKNIGPSGFLSGFDCRKLFNAGCGRDGCSVFFHRQAMMRH